MNLTNDNGKHARGFPRFDVNKWVICNFNGASTMSVASLKNLSGGGICILTEKRPEEGEIISIELSIPGEFMPAVIDGEVRWVRKIVNPEGKFLFSSGILFKNLQEKDRLKIINMVTKYFKQQTSIENTGVIAKKRKIMLVMDGDEIVISSMKDIFGTKFNLFFARNAEIGFKVAETNKPAIILMDIDMKMNDGTPLYETVKNNPDTSEIPLVLISRFGRTELVEKALRAGADDFLMTPSSLKKIMAMANE